MVPVDLYNFPSDVRYTSEPSGKFASGKLGKTLTTRGGIIPCANSAILSIFFVAAKTGALFSPSPKTSNAETCTRKWLPEGA